MNARNLRTVKQVARECPAFTEAGLRKMIFEAELNGLGEALVRIGRRVLIDADRFDEWVEHRRRGRATASVLGRAS